MASIDIKSLSTSDRIVAGASAIALISLFLPWYGFSSSIGSASVSGFGSGYGFLGGLLIVLSGAYLVMMRSGASMPSMSVGPGVIVFGTSLVGIILVLLKWANLPSGSIGDGSYGPRIGIYLTLIVGIVQAVYALRFFRASGERAPWAK